MTAVRRLKVGVLVSGRGSNLQAILDAGAAGHLSADVAVVLSDVPDAYALARARHHNVAALFEDPKAHPNREAFDKALIGHLERHRVDLVCLAGFMRLLTPGFVAHYRNRIMNIHPALLPAFPGLHVQRKALQHGVKFSGCTVHFVDEGTDTGPIVIQAVVPVLDDDTEEILSARILRYEHQIYPRAIQLYAEGRLRVEGRRVLCTPPPGGGTSPEFGGFNP
ncbi:MAG: phosphoribosylglycinamide formyltransferase [candidate division NC10 bacterium]|nr:phosphoribosylglycinamide formyltransferase [candidate division NC10 bacterium]